MRTPDEATTFGRPSSPPLDLQVVEVGPVVLRPGRDISSDIVYSVTLPSGYVATSPESFPDHVPPPLVALDQRRT